MDNAMFVLEIVKITYSVLLFSGLKLETTSLSYESSPMIGYVKAH
jgi:hypothetical protein